MRREHACEKARSQAVGKAKESLEACIQQKDEKKEISSARRDITKNQYLRERQRRSCVFVCEFKQGIRWAQKRKGNVGQM